MLYQYLRANDNEDYSSDNLRFFLEDVSGSRADQHSEKTKEKSHTPDHHYSLPYIDWQEGEWYTDRERIDAGSYTEYEEVFPRKIVSYGLCIILHRLMDHVDTESSEEEKCDPVIHRLDIRSHTNARKPADKWHDRLEYSKHRTQYESTSQKMLSDRESRRYGYSKCIHRKGKSNEK